MLWKCDACKTLYAVDMPHCPQCGQTGHTEVDSGGEPVGPRFAPADEPETGRAELEPEPAKATGKTPGKVPSGA